MIEKIGEYGLKTGNLLTVLKLTAPIEPELSEELEFFLQTDKTDDWKQDIHKRINGDYTAFTVDKYFVGIIEERIISVLWYGLSKFSGKGNFGHVYTDTRYRGLGILNHLMRAFDADFHAGNGIVLTCTTSNSIAVNCYLKFGFELIFGGGRGPMALVRRELGKTFADLERVGVDGGPVISVREGTPAEQFDCDKFLMYTHAMRERGRLYDRCFITAGQCDYRQVILKAFDGRGNVTVAENGNGEVVGYAYAINFGNADEAGNATLDFTIHPDYWGQAECLAAAAAERFDGTVRVYLNNRDAEKMRIFEHAGFIHETRLKSYFQDGDLAIMKYAG